MRFLAFALCLFAAPALAAAPEDDYLATRDKYIAKIKKLEKVKNGEDAVQAEHDKDLADLEKRLQAIIGDASVKGFPAKGKINLDSLTDSGVGFGMLDALRFQSGEEGPTIVVTTDALFDKWLTQWRKEEKKAPAQAEAALRSDSFYTSAIGSDAAYTRSAVLEIEKPAGVDFAFAQMGGWAQDIGPNDSQEMIVTLRKGGKLYIASSALKAAAAKIPACGAIWSAAQKKAEKQGGEARMRTEEKGDADYHACFNARAPQEKWFPAVVKEAQDFAARAAGK